MTRRSLAVRSAAALLLLTAVGCGDGDGSGPDITLPSTTTTDASSAGSTTTTTEGDTSTTDGRDDHHPVADHGDHTGTGHHDAPRRRRPPPRRRRPPRPHRRPPRRRKPPTRPPRLRTEATDDDSTSWWWLVLLLAGLGILAFILWRRSHAAPPWAERAASFADEVDAAGRSVLLGPELTPGALDDRPGLEQRPASTSRRSPRPRADHRGPTGRERGGRGAPPGGGPGDRREERCRRRGRSRPCRRRAGRGRRASPCRRDTPDTGEPVTSGRHLRSERARRDRAG